MNDVLIIGAGAAGLAAAYELKQLGISVSLIEKAALIGAPWRGRHEQLCLNTHRDLSNIPGLEMPKSYPIFPTRDQFIRYLEDYIDFLDVPIEFGIEATKIAAQPQGGYVVTTSKGQTEARHVVIATGSDHQPYTPEWPNQAEFKGELIHSGEFRHAKHYRDKSILIVGAGNSGVDIANHLAKESIKPSWMTVRKNGAWIAPKDIFGIPLQPIARFAQGFPPVILDVAMALLERILLGDLRKLGLPRPSKGAATRQIEDNQVPSLDDGFIASVKKGLFSFVPEISAFTTEGVELVDGQTLNPDVIICATGYRLGLQELVGTMKVLNIKGVPTFLADESCSAHPGLWFFGLNTSLFGNFYIRRSESKRLAEKIKRQLEK
ncbi:MAG: dimethylaniline monooxygenase [Moraxellaceae bacterium]|nr:MAG: dimethylaniline monooxygenase [Moraxellaceae bacterium]